MIKKFFTYFGMVSFFALCVYGITMLGYRITYGNIQQSSKEYTDKVTPLIFSQWNFDQLRANSHRRFIEAAPTERLKILFSSLAKIGPMKSFKGSSCGAGMTYFSSSDGTFAWAKCMNSAEFEKGSAKMVFTLLKDSGNDWLIKDINIDQKYRDDKNPQKESK